MTTPGKLPHVVILGGGFGGLYAARALEGAPVRLTVVDRQNHHLFQPLLYQVATATLNPSEVASPIRRLVHPPQATVLMAEVREVRPEAKQVLLSDGTTLDYDFLVMATGATHSFFGNDGWAAHTLGLKTVDDALEVRRRVLLAYERAEREPDPELRRQLLTFVIIGAGPTGVEMAGALAEIARHSLARDFHQVDPASTRILLLEGQPRVLPVYPESLSEQARRSLEQLGVEVRTGTRVTNIDETGVWVGDEHLPAGVVLWAAGVAASPLARSLGAPLDRAGRVQVTPFLTVPGREDTYVVGDLAHLEQDGQVLPGLAPVAIQMGKHVAKNLRRALQGKALLPFRYWDRGSFAVIGRGSAVGVAFKRLRMGGLLGWLSWLGVHLLFLIGFRSRLVVLVNWAYAFLTWRKSARLITGVSPAVLAQAPTTEQLPRRTAASSRAQP